MFVPNNGGKAFYINFSVSKDVGRASAARPGPDAGLRHSQQAALHVLQQDVQADVLRSSETTLCIASLTITLFLTTY